jgi:hypothetical protein
LIFFGMKASNGCVSIIAFAMKNSIQFFHQ